MLGTDISDISALRSVEHRRSCSCPEGHLSCASSRLWMRFVRGIIRTPPRGPIEREAATVHPASYTIALVEPLIELLSHPGEVVFDPFTGSGTTVAAAVRSCRQGVGVELVPEYAAYAKHRAEQEARKLQLFAPIPEPVVVCGDSAKLVSELPENTVKCVITSPPYWNLTRREWAGRWGHGGDKGARGRHYDGGAPLKTDIPGDVAAEETLEGWIKAVSRIFENLRPKLRPDAQVVIETGDMWESDAKKPLFIGWRLIPALEAVGYKLQNVLIWDRNDMLAGVKPAGRPRRFYRHIGSFHYLHHYVVE